MVITGVAALAASLLYSTLLFCPSFNTFSFSTCYVFAHIVGLFLSLVYNIPADVDATARPPSRSCGYSGGGKRRESRFGVRPPSLSRPACCARSLILVVFSSPWVAVECAGAGGVSYLPTSPRRAVHLEQGGKEDPVPVNVWLELARKRSLLPSVRPRFLCAMRLACKYAASYDLDSCPTRDSCNISFDQGIESVDVTRFWVAHSGENDRARDG